MPPFVHCSAETVACCNPAQRHARTTRRPSARTAWRPHAIRAAPEGLQKVGTRSGEAARDVWRAAGADERWRATSARPARRAARPAPDASAASLSLPPLHPRSHRATSRTAEQGPRSCGFPAHLAGRCFPLTATTAPRSHACQGGGRWRWLNPRLGMTKQQDCRHARRRRCPASVDGILPRRPQGVRADAQVPPSLKKVMASTQPAVQWHHVASWVGVAKAGHAVWARGGPKGSARDWLQSQTAGRQERTGAEGSLPCWRGRCSFLASTACDWSPCASASGFSSHGPWRQVRSSAVRARGSPAHGGHGVSQRMPQNLTASPRNLSKSSPRGGGAGPGRGSRARMVWGTASQGGGKQFKGQQRHHLLLQKIH
ncbi:unnamed protein product [Prorocentrum cordatum]|uniref:Uncharacterized protein n=1 Tax=Prorocentrum cordatum TaxID=2364126 RepID=A0ABN9TKD0_9DINO|nr:unnamed protein product [Polarella glacialis]